MTYVERFSDTELEKIIEAGPIYMCACPAQVAEAIRNLRALHCYQLMCLNDPRNESTVHRAIAVHVAIAHAQMQDCLEEVMILEKWDRTTLEMPKGLRRQLVKEMLED